MVYKAESPRNRKMAMVARLCYGAIFLAHPAKAHMADPDGYTTIRTSEDVRDKARVTKAKLCMTWDEFVERAAETLDPDTER
jgi:hypothetical protein